MKTNCWCLLDLMHRWKVSMCVVQGSLKSLHVPTLLRAPVAACLAAKLTRTEAPLPGRPTRALRVRGGRGDLWAAGQTRGAAGQVQAWDMQWQWSASCSAASGASCGWGSDYLMQNLEWLKTYNIQSMDAIYLTSNLSATNKCYHYLIKAHKWYSEAQLHPTLVLYLCF